MVPSTEDCLKLLEEEGIPSNILSHIMQVNRIAVLLARKLQEKGIDIDVNLVNAASLLHDLKKWDEISNKKHSSHGKDAHDALVKKYPEVAKIVVRHMLYEILDPGLDTWEEKVVHYADRRVNHDRIVSIRERFDYLNKRYPPKDKERREKVYTLNLELEKEIFSKLDFGPDELKSILNS